MSLTDDEFSETFDLVESILSSYDMEDNDEYICAVSHLVTIIELLKDTGELGLTQIINGKYPLTTYTF